MNETEKNSLKAHARMHRRELDELERLRNRKREWEHERANLLQQWKYQRERMDTLAIERDASDEEVKRLTEIINEMARVTFDGLAKLKDLNE